MKCIRVLLICLIFPFILISLTKSTSANNPIETAISWALEKEGQYLEQYDQYCHNFVIHAYQAGGISVDQYTGLGGAIGIYGKYEDTVISNKDSKPVPPRGTMVLYKNNEIPHTALSLGDGLVINSNYGNILTQDYLAFTNTGYTYLGWLSVEDKQQPTTPPTSNELKEEWIAVYVPDISRNNVVAVVTDHEDNIIVIGTTRNGVKYATVKYDPEGNKLWSSYYRSSHGGFSRASDIAVDHNGNIFVTGTGPGPERSAYGFITVKYDGDTGEELWDKYYNSIYKERATDHARAIAVDGSGDVYVTGSTNNREHTNANIVKYRGSDGEKLWVSKTNAHYLLNSIITDTTGHVYAAGYMKKTDQQSGFYTVKLRCDNGNQVWENYIQYSEGTYRNGTAEAIILDNNGDVIVTGVSRSGDDNQDDATTIKFSGRDGSLIWISHYNGKDYYDGPHDWTGRSRNDWANDIAVDDAGNIYVTGATYGGTTGGWAAYDYLTLKYNGENGNLVWHSRYDGDNHDDGGANTSSGAKAIAVDSSSGSVYVTGQSRVDGVANYVTIRYESSSGKKVSKAIYEDGTAVDLALDSSGNLYVTGISDDTYVTIKYYKALKTDPVDPDPDPDTEAHTVSFNLNGAPGTTPASQTILHGDYISKPKSPTWLGYRFAGWYANPAGEGIRYFGFYNNYRGWKVKSDFTLYAKWIQPQETYSFTNRSSNFFDSLLSRKYTIDDEYFNTLIEGRTKDERESMRKYRNENWSGSCYGMSNSMVLFNEGKLAADFFQKGARSIEYLELPKNNNIIRSMINYYQIANHATEVRNLISQHIFPGQPEKYHENLINETMGDRMLIISFFWVDDSEDDFKGHAAVSYKYQQQSDGKHKIFLHDPNYDSKNRQHVEPCLLIDADLKRAYYHNEKGIARQVIIKYYHNSSLLDSINLQRRLMDRGYQTAPDTSLFLNEANIAQNKETLDYVTLTTNYNSFIISDDQGREAVVDGLDITGDLIISTPVTLVSPEVDLIMNTYFLKNQSSYYVTPLDENDFYKTELHYRGDDGSYSAAKTTESAKVSFKTNGVVSVESDLPNNIAISTTINSAITPWYTVAVEANLQDLTLTPSLDNNVISSTSSLGAIEVAVLNDHNEIPLSLNTSETSVVVKNTVGNGGDSNVAIAKLDDEILAETPLTYAAVFRTYGGSPVESQRGLSCNSLVERPEDPTFPGFIFAGWYKDADCTDGEEWDFATDIIYGDTTIHAKWVEDENFLHEVRFIAEGFDDIIIILYDGESIDNAPDVPQKEGYKGNWDTSDFSNIKADMIVNAIYTAITGYKITLTANPEEGGEVSEGGSFEPGEEVTVTASANSGYKFANWTEGGKEVSTDSSYTFNVTSDRELVANFTKDAAIDNDLSALEIDPGTLNPSFDKDITTYKVDVDHAIDTVNITATLSNKNASLTINGEAATSGEAKEITLGATGSTTTIDVVVTSVDGTTEKTYSVEVTRASEETPENYSPSYIYYENPDGKLVRADYNKAVEDLLEGDPRLRDAIRKAIKDAIDFFGGIYVEAESGIFVDYGNAVDAGKTYPDCFEDLPKYGVDSKVPDKELVINPTTGEAEEVNY